MGFFPVCPGRPVYDIGSPIFQETRLTLGDGKVFTITARNVSAVNKYIQSATLNGNPWNKPWFEHKDMANGTLVLEMGPRPNTAWEARRSPPGRPSRRRSFRLPGCSARQFFARCLTSGTFVAAYCKA